MRPRTPPTFTPASEFAGYWQSIVDTMMLPPTVSLVQTLGNRIRKRRILRALTLDDLASLTGISKPYLSLIETARVPYPPSSEKLDRVEEALALPRGSLVAISIVSHTPPDVRDLLTSLLITSPRTAKNRSAD